MHILPFPRLYYYSFDYDLNSRLGSESSECLQKITRSTWYRRRTVGAECSYSENVSIA